MAKTATKRPKTAQLTADQQIGVIGSLKQKAAAWLLGMRDARSIRDATDIPRSPDGTYDARALVAWAAGRIPDPTFSDTEWERLLASRDLFVQPSPFGGSDVSLAAGPIVECFDQLEAKHGQAVFTAFGRMLVGYCRDCVAHDPEGHRRESEDEVRERIMESVEDRVQDELRSPLDAMTVCPGCDRLRHGKRWLKKETPTDCEVRPGRCPSCEET